MDCGFSMTNADQLAHCRRRVLKNYWGKRDKGNSDNLCRHIL